MEVCFYSTLKDKGGAARVVNLLSKFLSKKGHIIRHFSEEENNISFEHKSAIWHFHTLLNWSNILASLPKKDKIVITAHDFRVFSGGCVFPVNCVQWEQKCENCPQQIFNATKIFEFQKKILFSIKPLIIVPSNWLKKILKKIMPWLKVKVIPNGVEVEYIHPQFDLLRYKQKLVLFVAHGGLKAGFKGGGSWLSIWNRIKVEHPDARAIVIGDVEKKQVQDVLILPYLSSAAVWKVMERASLFLYPTLADNYPLVILEAMAAGLPVLAYGVGGIKEQIDSNKTGFLIEPFSQEDLIKQAILLLQHASKLKEVGQLAREKATKYFSWQKMGYRYLKEYEKLDG